MLCYRFDSVRKGPKLFYTEIDNQILLLIYDQKKIYFINNFLKMI